MTITKEELIKKTINNLDTYSYHLINQPMSKETKIKLGWEIENFKQELIKNAQ